MGLLSASSGVRLKGDTEPKRKPRRHACMKNNAPRTEKVDKRTKRRQLFRLVENLIVQHCNKNNGHAPYKEIVATCQYEFGLAKKEAEGIINALVELGILIRPNKLKPRMQQPPTAKKTVQIEEALPLADD